MEQEWALWVTLIAAVVSAFFAVLTFVKDISKDKIKIEVSNVYVTMDEVDKQVRYNFSINNLSERPIVITNVKLYRGNEELVDNGHKPSPYKSPSVPSGLIMGSGGNFIGQQHYLETPRFHMISSNFDNVLVIYPHNSKHFSYYLYECPNRIDVFTSKPKQTKYPISVDFEKELNKEIEEFAKTN